MPAERTGLFEQLEARGVTRRDFMKYCASVATLIGLEATAAPQIAAALEQTSALKPVIWLEAGSCSGCTESTAQADNPDIATIVLDILSINYTETLMAGAGLSAEEAKKQTIAAGDYILIYEGAVMTGWDGNAQVIAGVKGTEELVEAAKSAQAVVAVGSCAVDGGWVKAYPNPGGATGCSEYLKSQGVETPVINLPTCPVNPEWVVAVVIDALVLDGLKTGAILDKLDQYGRPTYIFGQTIHDNCPRRGHFENGEFVYKFGSPEEAKGYCLYAMGCKGPQTYTNCPIVRWNRRVSWCVESGSPCIGCGGFDWVDQNAPFLKRFREVGLGTFAEGGGSNAAVWGPVGFGVVAGALGVHAIGMAAAGRVGHEPTTEDEKDYDRKRQAKGGDE